METGTIKPGTYVWLAKNEYEKSKRMVGRVIAIMEDDETNSTFYVDCNDLWYLRTSDKLQPLTEPEKVLYMLESGKQCK